MATTEKFITIHSAKTNHWFFTTDHCQPNLSAEWVPITYYNRFGKYKDASHYSEYMDGIRIPNPDPKYCPFLTGLFKS